VNINIVEAPKHVCYLYHNGEEEGKKKYYFVFSFQYLVVYARVNIYLMIDIGLGSIGSSSAAPNLEDDEIDAEMYIQPGNPYFYAKQYDNRPNILV
jgi:hypothetical protein